MHSIFKPAGEEFRLDVEFKEIMDEIGATHLEHVLFEMVEFVKDGVLGQKLTGTLKSDVAPAPAPEVTEVTLASEVAPAEAPAVEAPTVEAPAQ